MCIYKIYVYIYLLYIYIYIYYIYIYSCLYATKVSCYLEPSGILFVLCSKNSKNICQ